VRVVLLAAVLATTAAAVPAALPAQVPPPPANLRGLHQERLEGRVEERVRRALLAASAEEVEARDRHLAAAGTVSEALVQGYPDSARAWYWRAVALGVRTEFAGPFEKLRVGPRVLEATLRTLELDPRHPGGHELMGRLHAAVMRLPWVVRQVALRAGMGDSLDGASWEQAERHFRIAAAGDPGALAPRLELGKLLVERDRHEDAARVLRELVALRPGHEVERRLWAEGDSLLALVVAEGRHGNE
jgi:hypothetical protein